MARRAGAGGSVKSGSDGDKPDIRTVIHYDLPASLDVYCVQRLLCASKPQPNQISRSAIPESTDEAPTPISSEQSHEHIGLCLLATCSGGSNRLHAGRLERSERIAGAVGVADGREASQPSSSACIR